MTKILLTGGTGFIGSYLLSKLPSQTRVFGRRLPQLNCEFIYGDIRKQTDFNDILDGVDVVIHLAAIAHNIDTGVDVLSHDYREVNVVSTIRLAEAAAKQKVKRFVFLSSVNVFGLQDPRCKPFSSVDVLNPIDITGISKAEAEHGLREIGSETGMEITIIRSPLVYGPGVKANFAAMLNIAAKNLPLPLGAIHNARSMVALPNLVELILCCIEHPNAANQTFLVSDGVDVSTSELLRQMTIAWGKKPRLLPVPTGLLTFCLAIIGKKSIAERLFGSLQVDISDTCRALNWQPKPLLQETLRDCVAAINEGSK